MSSKEDLIKCNNCRQFISNKKMFLHEGFCNRNNVFCEHCESVFLKKDYNYHILEISRNLSPKNRESISNQIKKNFKNLKIDRDENEKVQNIKPFLGKEQIQLVEEYKINNPIVLSPFGEIISKKNKNEFILPMLGINHKRADSTKNIFLNHNNIFNINNSIIKYENYPYSKKLKPAYSTSSFDGLYNLYKNNSFIIQNNSFINNLESSNNSFINNKNYNRNIFKLKTNQNGFNNNNNFISKNEQSKINNIIFEDNIESKNNLDLIDFINNSKEENSQKKYKKVRFNNDSLLNKKDIKQNEKTPERRIIIDQNIANFTDINFYNKNNNNNFITNTSPFNTKTHFHPIRIIKKSRIKNIDDVQLSIKIPLDNISKKNKKNNSNNIIEKIPKNNHSPKISSTHIGKKSNEYLKKCEYCNIITDNLNIHYNYCSKKNEYNNIIKQKNNNKLGNIEDYENIIDSGDDEKNKEIIIRQIKPTFLKNNSKFLYLREPIHYSSRSQDKNINKKLYKAIINENNNKKESRNKDSPEDNIKGRNMLKTQQRNYKRNKDFKLENNQDYLYEKRTSKRRGKPKLNGETKPKNNKSSKNISKPLFISNKNGKK